MKEKYRKQQISTVGLVAHYKLWAGLTTTATVFDYALNGNTGTVTNALPAYPGFIFDGVDDVISCGSGTTIDNIFDATGTISIWLRSTAKGQGDVGMAITKEKWSLQLNSAQNSMKFTHVFTGDDGIWSFDVSGSVWEHVVLVYFADKSIDVPVVYVNGVAVAVATDQEPGSDTRTSDAGDSLAIGDNAASDSAWDGKIGEVMLFNTEKLADAAKSMFEISRWRHGV